MVSELSGGWRMKLAIACAMLQDATFLMLDEPTNHLDVNAIKWLIDYLCRLEGTTILFVSHDQDFLQKVATDVIHFAHQKLSYYPGYAAFREAQPDAALGAFKAFQVRSRPNTTSGVPFTPKTRPQRRKRHPWPPHNTSAL
jgi:ATPase subunit of ABC transporter with duplicated ATPase domains